MIFIYIYIYIYRCECVGLLKIRRHLFSAIPVDRRNGIGEEKKIYFVQFGFLYGLFGWRGEGGRIEGSKIELAKNKLILC